MAVTLGVVTGLRSEARIIEKSASRAGAAGSVLVRASGARPPRARSCAEDLVKSGVQALLSFGIAGGLDPALSPGDVILATAIRPAADGERPCAAAWRDRLSARLGSLPIRAGAIAGSGEMIDDAQAKSRLFRATGAVAVDMESLAVSEIAARAGLPFLAIRAIADPAARAPPARALDLVAEDGGTRVGAALAAIAANPAALPLYLRLTSDSRAALRSLRRVAAVGGPLFGLV